MYSTKLISNIEALFYNLKMSLKTYKLNLLHNFKQKVCLVLHLDIEFIKKKCKRNNVSPNFIKIKIPIINITTEKVLHGAKTNWLNEH